MGAQLATLTDLYGIQLAKNGSLMAYLGMIAMAGAYGLSRGWEVWYQWLQSREPYHLKNKTLQPIVNATVDGAKLVFDTVSTTGGTMLTAATFPVSVPLLLALNQEEQDPGEGTEKVSMD
mgnify:CR=1 FL=1